MIKNIKTEELKELIETSNKPVIVDFYKAGYVPCKVMVPILAQIDSENPDKYVITRINVEENPDAALEYRVLSVPTLLFIKEGKQVGKLEGSVTKNVVEQKLAKYMG